MLPDYDVMRQATSYIYRRLLSLGVFSLSDIPARSIRAALMFSDFLDGHISLIYSSKLLPRPTYIDFITIIISLSQTDKIFTILDYLLKLNYQSH